MGTLYAIPDFVSLFMVKRMANSTIAHHVCCASSTSRYLTTTKHNIMRCIVIYAIFLYLRIVNLLLASRFLNVTDIVSAFQRTRASYLRHLLHAQLELAGVLREVPFTTTPIGRFTCSSLQSRSSFMMILF